MNSSVEPTQPVPVAIIGMGCLFPRAGDLSRYWANIRDRRDAITDVPPTHWRPEDYFDPDPRAPDRTYARRGGFLDPVDFPALEFGIAPHNLEATDTTQLLGLLVAREALEDAGYGSGRAFDRDRVSVILGVTGTLELVIPLGARLGHPIWRRALKAAGVDETITEEVVRGIADSYVGWQENSFPGLLGNVAAGRIANRLDLGGTNCVIDAACASSIGAVNLALLELATGRCDMALTGGLDSFNDIFMYMCFSKTPALSPTGEARPFDASGDGTILGEGLGVIVLKRLDDARRDGDKVYAVIRSVGTSSDGKGNAVYAPSAVGQAKALRQAYRLAGVSPETVELVEAHGTGTKVGDATELVALTEVYREARAEGTWCALGSVKSQIGHTKAAAGAAGIIKAALALHRKVLPPTAKVTQPVEGAAPGASPFFINTEPRPWMPRPGHPRRAAVSAFGFGGSNFHCVLEEAGPEIAGIDWDGDTQIVAFSADDEDGLRRTLDAWPTGLAWDSLRVEAARSRSAFKADHPHRLLLVVERDGADLTQTFDKARSLVGCGQHTNPGSDRRNGALPGPHDDIFVGHGPAAGDLAMLFPGQGSQYVGMLRSLACQFPMVHATLAEADAEPLDDGRRLSDLIYPQPAFSDPDRARHEDALRATEVAQLALGALGLGVFRLLDYFGVRPDAVAGHSFGELTALCAAGRFDAAALALLARRRGRLMADRAGQGGAMLAVLAPIETVVAAVRDERLDLVIANKNAPRQAVLSGTESEVARAETLFATRRVATRRLAVSAAFHSRLVAGASGPLLETLRSVAIVRGEIPVFSNTTASPYPDDPDAARALLAGQLAEPVEFVAEVEAMHRSGLRTFLEVGPDGKLVGLVGAILDGRPHAALAVDASRGRRGNVPDLARALAHLGALGHPVDLSRWDEQEDARTPEPRRSGLAVKVCGANATPRPQASAQAMPGPAPRTRETAPKMKPTNPARPSQQPPDATPTNGDQVAHVGRNGTTPGHASPRANGTPEAPAPLPHPIAPSAFPPLRPGDPAILAQALRDAQDHLVALQKLGEQTAQLHKQFLDGQEKAQRTFQTLLEQQQRLTFVSLGLDAPPPPIPPAPPSRPLVAEPVEHRFSPPIAPEPPTPRFAATPPARFESAPPVAPKPLVSDRVHGVLVAIVSEKTGYPAEMLEPDMQLDADLGIDSIKRVEILSAVQDRLPDAPVVKPEHLGTLRTLRQIADFLARGTVSAPVTAAPAPVDSDRVQLILLEIVSEKTGYPAEMLEPDMQLDADLGIDSIKRVEILSAVQERLPDAPVVKSEHLGTLRTLRQIADFLTSSPPVAAGPESALVPSGTSDPLQRLVVSSVAVGEGRETCVLRDGAEVWIADDGSKLAAALVSRLRASGSEARVVDRDLVARPNPPARLDGLVLLATGEGDGAAIKDSFRLLRAAAPALRRAGREGGAFFATVSRLDGAFGFRGLAADASPTSGALAGLAKTAAHEWPEVACKAIDLDPGLADPDRTAALLLDELLQIGPTEVGLTSDGPTTLRHAPSASPRPGGSAPIDPGDVVVISGGARGVTAEVAVALAGSFRPTVVLLGRSPEPSDEPDWLATLTDEAEIKRTLATRANGHATPQAIGEQFRGVSTNREIRRNLRRIEEAGGRALYRSVDVRDAEAVGECLAAIRDEFGPVRVLVHGAGVLADRRIEDQTDEQFAAVFDTKVAGLRALLGAIEGDDLRALVLFSSSTARFGRTGQVAYAAANEALNKWALREAQRRPGCRVVAVNWGPWDGGMVTPSLRPLFESEGVGLIPLRDGARFLVEELRASAADRPVEVVVLGPGTVLEPDPNSNPDPDPSPTPSSRPRSKTTDSANPTMVLAFERRVDVDSVPVLRSHVIAGRPVLPMALVLEWLAQAALQRNPGLAFCGIDELRILKGVVLRDGRAETLQVLAGKPAREDSTFRVPVELRGTTDDGSSHLHARGVAILADRPPEGRREIEDADLAPLAIGTAEAYRDVLFHGPDLHGIGRIEGCDDRGIAATAATAPPPSAWIDRPARSTWLADPLALDCAFQLMIIWSHERIGGPSLPTFLGRYRQFRRAFPADGVRILARVTQTCAHRALADIEFLDADRGLVARIDDYECVIDASLGQAFRQNRLESVSG